MKKIILMLFLAACSLSKMPIEMNQEYASHDHIVRLMLLNDSIYVYSKGNTGMSYGSWKINSDEGYVLNSNWKEPRDINQINANFQYFENVKLRNDNGDTLILEFDSDHLLKLYKQDSISSRIDAIRDEYYK